MLKKPITYVNYNGIEVTKNFYFNLTKAEISARELTSDGTFSETLKAISESKKASEVYPEFVKILKWAYGVKSADGEFFVKNDTVWEQFEQSPAYSVLIMELITNGDASAQFINAIMPSDLAARAAEARAQDGFRPGAQTLPQSQIDALAAQQAPVVPPAQDFSQVAAEFAHPADQGLTRQSEPRTPDVQDFGQ